MNLFKKVNNQNKFLVIEIIKILNFKEIIKLIYFKINFYFSK